MADSVEVVITPLAWKRKLAYGVGHILNDLCAAMWFNYLLIFYHSVLQFSNNMAGLIMLLGQVADAVSTPFVGIESDRANGMCGYGKRKSWHLIGTVCVMCSYPFLFFGCLGGARSADWAKFIYYAPFVVIFQFGWASTQISHLALLPSLTPCESDRVGLNAIRYTGTVMSNIAVYSIAWILLTQDDSSTHLLPTDLPQFRLLVLIIVGVGVLFSVIFHLGTPEESGVHNHLSTPGQLDEQKTAMTWRDWFKEPQFYLIGVLYMGTRLIVNISQIYIPMFLLGSLKLAKHYIAIVPLIVFVSGFVVSLVMKPVNKTIGRKATYGIGCVLVIGACVWFWFLSSGSLLVIAPAILIGAGTSTILVTSLSFTADLIGDNCSSGAFVYGCMSFSDKLSNGIAVVFIQFFHPCKTEVCCPACVWYYRDALVFIPGGIAILVLILLLAMIPVKIGHLRKFKSSDTKIVEEPTINGETRPLLS